MSLLSGKTREISSTNSLNCLLNILSGGCIVGVALVKKSSKWSIFRVLVYTNFR